MIVGASLVVACSDPADPDREDAGPEDAGCIPSVPTFAELTLHEATLRWDGGSAGCRAIPLVHDRYEVTGEERDVDAGYFSRRSAFWVRNPSFYDYELWVSSSDELTVACDQTHNAGPNYYGTTVHISRLALTARTPQGWTFQGSGLLSDSLGTAVARRAAAWRGVTPPARRPTG